MTASSLEHAGERILITPRSITRDGHPSLSRLTDAGYELSFAPAGEKPTEADLMQLLPGCAAMLAGVETISADVLEAADRLRVIARNGVGVDNIDLAAAERLSIKVCRAVGANARGVAELTIGLTLALARAIPFSDSRLKSGRWERRKGFELAGKTMGIVGCGCIGQQVAGLVIGLGMRVVAFDPAPESSFRPSGEFSYAGLSEVLAQADVISLHCPAPRDGKPLINAAALAAMKPGAVIVNTARPELLDDEAVLGTLDTGRLAGLAMDVHRQEPPNNSRLVGHDRVIATPHIGGYTDESVDRAVGMAVEAILENLSGILRKE
ncbi:MAG: phosphoglycerate dehydrogenase [Planctomycetes bacterium]|jgi:D-3-phosphoglycerate dehydrogenase|nr:phosphoglycerate dehydrogenase [Planctomycetota bacterium]